MKGHFESTGNVLFLDQRCVLFMKCQWTVDLYVQFYAWNYASIKVLKNHVQWNFLCFIFQREKNLWTWMICLIEFRVGWVCRLLCLAQPWGLWDEGENSELLGSWLVTWPRCPGWRWGVHTSLFLKFYWTSMAQRPIGGPTLENGPFCFPQVSYPPFCFELVCILPDTLFSALQRILVWLVFVGLIF